ncbi:MAG: alanine--tRNA ligase-related protein, partial [Chthoniobacterales bacterium]
DPAVHIVNGNKKDNFWMMGDTGPCGPCSELHIDLTPAGDTNGALVNAGDPRCIEIWNLVFIQFNANADGTFSPLPQRHVDTGMGFERVSAMIQGTNNFTDFSRPISNYETDVFRPIFDDLETLSGKRYGSTLPRAGSTGDTEQEKIDIAFRVIADHIRTLSFAIADGIQPSNEGRGYVLRRILRRAVRYGRTLGFHEPFFYKVVEIVIRTVGGVFPEVRVKQQLVRNTISREEESFNKTLDRGIELFEREVVRLSGTVGVSPAGSGILPERTVDHAQAANYTRRRRLPHFEQPWAIYAPTISTAGRRTLRPTSRTIVLNALRHFDNSRYTLIAACVMPDHVHILLQPWVKEQNEQGEAVFWSLGELMHSIKSFTAKEINKVEGTKGIVWEQERFDRYVRGDRDLEEKFRYIVTNPEREGLGTEYPWVWTQEDRSGKMPEPAGETPTLPETGVIPGEFAFRLYDEQGFPLDLTELMARERGLMVDVAGFEKLMEDQRERARRAQKKQAISVEDGKLDVKPTEFLGYDVLESEAVVEAVLPGRAPNELNIVLDRTACYAEMGGQVGDAGFLYVPGPDRAEAGRLKIADTQKRGEVFVHISALVEGRAPEPGEGVRVSVDAARRNPIERHHTVTHLLHWALHEIVSREAVQKGSYVGAEKLTFDFSSAALTYQQVGDVEKLVNERIAENANVSWIEIPYAQAKKRSDIQQFFGEKYGEMVRVVQIGGDPEALNGYSMELCGGTHVRATGEIRWFKIISESAIAAGTRRIEAVAGDEVLTWARQEGARQQEKFEIFSRKKPGIKAMPGFDQTNSETAVQSIEARASRLRQLETEVQEWEKQQAKAAEAELRTRAAAIASELAASHSNASSCVTEIANADGGLLQAVADALKTKIAVPIVLAGATNGRVDLVAVVPKNRTTTVRANEIIQRIAPIVGGKGGGKADGARGAGKDPSKIPEALEQARAMVA